jgi:hypothetical protein
MQEWASRVCEDRQRGVAMALPPPARATSAGCGGPRSDGGGRQFGVRSTRLLPVVGGMIASRSVRKVGAPLGVSELA